MAATEAVGSDLSLQISKVPHPHGAVVEEIEGLIRVYKDGCVERPQIVPSVTGALDTSFGVSSWDVLIDIFTNTWARFYVPNCATKLPLLLYFHGGGFCVGSASWSVYHDFLGRLAAKSGCLIMSVDYRLAPENPLPAAYEDAFKSLVWLKQEATSKSRTEDWLKRCDLSRIFLAGDSAGANIAYQVATRAGNSKEGASAVKPLNVKGIILIQPFFGGETRTHSEKHMAQPPQSALTLQAADTYWRLALPAGSNRDHPWCNPMAKGLIKMTELKLSPIMVCVSEMDILRDRNLEFCSALERAGKKLEKLTYKGVGHAFQVLGRSQMAQIRRHEMMGHITAFISR